MTEQVQIGGQELQLTIKLPDPKPCTNAIARTHNSLTIDAFTRIANTFNDTCINTQRPRYLIMVDDFRRGKKTASAHMEVETVCKVNVFGDTIKTPVDINGEDVFHLALEQPYLAKNTIDSSDNYKGKWVIGVYIRRWSDIDMDDEWMASIAYSLARTMLVRYSEGANSAYACWKVERIGKPKLCRLII